MGGLGNQMFQIAYARALALETADDVYIDRSAYKTYKIRSYSANNLYSSENLKFFEDVKSSILFIIYLRTMQKAYHIYQKIFKVVTRDLKIGSFSYSFLSRFGLYFNFDPYYYKLSLRKSKNKYLYGYFQSTQYFKDAEDLIKQELLVKTELTSKEKVVLHKIANCNAVAIVMRLGEDYSKSELLNICNEEYYQKAIDIINEKITNPVFFVFSDRIDIAKEKYKFNVNVEFIEGFNDYESLRLMYNCNHFIIVNSSFAWWGAYLSSNKEKLIVAPSKWYTATKKRPDIYLDSMVLIEV